MEHKLAIRTLVEQCHCVMTDFFFQPTYQRSKWVRISLLSQPQECREKSGSIHIYRAGVSTWAKNYCMTCSSVTSNLQVVNTVQHRVCAGTCVRACSSTVLRLETHINASAAEPLLFLSELCSACTEDDKQDHTQHSLHGQVTVPHSINTTVPPTNPTPYLSPPIHTHIPPLADQWEVTGGTWLKVNVWREKCTWSLAETWRGKKKPCTHLL